MGALTNAFGGRISDFRTKVVDAELANLQAVSATEASLKKRSAAAAPNFKEIFKLMASDEMHEIDSASDQAGIKAINSDFLQRAAKDPFIMFSKEGKQISSRINAYLQDPKRQTRIRNYETNSSAIGSAREDGIAGNQYVSQGLVGGVKRRFGTIEDQYQVLDKKLGGQEVLNITQGEFSQSLKNIQATLNNVGSFKTTQFKGVDKGLDTIEKVVNSNNRQQLAIVFEGLKDQSLISESDYDAFLSRAATLEVRDAKIAGESLNIDQLQHKAEVRAVDMFADIINGKTTDLTTRSLSQNSSLKGAGAGSNRDKITKVGPLVIAASEKNGKLPLERTTKDKDGVLRGVQYSVPTNEFQASVLYNHNSNKTDGRENFRDNEALNQMGANRAETLSVGYFGEYDGLISEKTRQLLTNRARIIDSAHVYEQVFHGDGRVFNDSEWKKYSAIQELPGITDRQKRIMVDNTFGAGIKSTELMSVKVEVALNENGKFSFGEDDNISIEELEEIGVGTWETWTEETIADYKEKGGIVNDNIDAGAKRYVVTLTSPTAGKTAAGMASLENKANVRTSTLNIGTPSSSGATYLGLPPNNFKGLNDVD